MVSFHNSNTDNYTFYDPTGEIELNINSIIEGTNIFNDKITTTEKKIIYGNYNTKIKGLVFEQEYTLNGNKLNTTKVSYLMPDSTQVIVSEEELNNINNYINDFQSLFSEMPSQFFIYKKDQVVSIGDIILLKCELDSYSRTGLNKVLFVPKENKNYEYDYNSTNGSCYQKIIIDNKVSSDIKFKFPVNELNSKKRNAKIALTFDIESGRYVNDKNKGPNAISQCSDNFYSLKLDKECISGNIIPYFSPTISNIYNYPWSTGISGLKEILYLSEGYGIPTTSYIVNREIPVYESLSPNLIEEMKKFSKEGKIEIGSHTYYHRVLGLNIDTDKEDLQKSKEELELEFETKVYGMRGPYLTEIKNIETHTKILEELNYKYYTNTGEFTINNNIKSLGPNYNYVSESEQNHLKNAVQNYDYILTLDHPWNLVVDEVEINNEVYLRENTSKTINFRKAVFLMINEGGIFFKANDLINTFTV